MLRKEYEQEPGASEIMELGVALLWTQRYLEAWQHFREAVEAYPRSISSFYGMAGTAKWCVNDLNAAVEQWHEGLNAKYADAGGAGVTCAMLLYVASIVAPKVFSKPEAMGLLSKKSKDPRSRHWPGPLAKFVPGQMTENVLRAQSLGQASQRESNSWLIDFYLGIEELDHGKVAQYRRSMLKTVETTRETTDHNFFLTCLWHEEFFLARHAVEDEQ